MQLPTRLQATVFEGREFLPGIGKYATVSWETIKNKWKTLVNSRKFYKIIQILTKLTHSALLFKKNVFFYLILKDISRMPKHKILNKKVNFTPFYGIIKIHWMGDLIFPRTQNKSITTTTTTVFWAFPKLFTSSTRHVQNLFLLHVKAQTIISEISNLYITLPLRYLKVTKAVILPSKRIIKGKTGITNCVLQSQLRYYG